MYCLFSKSKDTVPDCYNNYVLFVSGSTHFLIIGDSDIHLVDGWNRVSLSKAKKFAFRDSTQWINPDTSVEGRKRIQDMEQEWFSSFYK